MKIKFILTLICSLSIQLFIAQTEIKKPKETFGLYLDAFLRNATYKIKSIILVNNEYQNHCVRI
ncbi:hypothetical protein ATB99_05560 [Elizabethkingia meningoseptica]|uniref:Uncharacterized protein n=1 Tax=Elizabethkingia meningoseptica TaxID=238 RepID=A0A1V3U1C2_ELIME|nr:hypothetical protein BBD33_05155 [Elizabethkingia meningoseptica]AQX12135.1 hypothetical protein BBD35_06985 [Elizabethkingia meningoseptica]AQX46713.1 hypothetical protein B5G46_05150 [Elizabethkingia meningoseptica]KUY19227.1 hypothetical protein ATB99_05560 [Elizabethkingia meningoseptica]MVW91890.1 hypothetical protein [Elizabethkingia meningoseptica]